eukprot:TRINITY_DN938_c0_g1_i1.p1 TRINITY_DN938_c0_g1~~TRINITY_DN938_c0_g1_i1.p1  ORF type:complete len:196 (-),score=27.29 TRINITY_DN938_c0_g1_i1:103-690(-)
MLTYKIVVLGSGSVGKSAITLRFIHGKFVEQYDPTIEDSYRHAIEVDNENYILEVLDTAGTEQFAQLRNLYVKNGMGFILVFSIISRASYLEITDLHEQIVRVKESEDVPMVVVGNKIDMEDTRQVPRKEAEGLCKTFKCEYVESSAKTNTNIDLIFQTIVRLISASRPSKGRGRASTRGGKGGSSGGGFKCVIL